MPKIRYQDDKMTAFESDVDKIRNKPLMYVGLLGVEGSNHCCREAINNAIDECSKPKSVTPGNEIWITIDEKNDAMTVTDNGRGINPDEVVDIYTTLNMGSNMTRSHGYTLGENGVGSLCIAALARETIIKSFRGLHDKKVYTYTFREGKLIDQTSEPCGDKHGLLVQYKPSRKVFGRDAHIDVDALLEWIRAFQYRMDPKLTINVETLRSNSKENTTDVIKAKPFRNIIIDNNEHLFFNVEGFSFDGEMEEEFGGTTQNRTFHCDVAFGYTDSDTPYISSFCNGAHTTDHGSHLDGVVNGITKYLKEAVINSLTDKEKETITIQNTDVQTGLTVSVNIMTDMMRLFVSQIKTKVDNSKLAKQLANMVYEELSKQKMSLKLYIEMIKTNAKARIEASLIRQKTLREGSGKWDRYSVPNFLPCASTDKTKTELYICEGISARGSLRQARDPSFQAIYCIRGFPLNPYGKALSQILANDVYKNLIGIMGCGIGDNFSLNRLKYSKIVIATDADKAVTMSA